MASLVSPGVSVPFTDESFFIPSDATTTALFFIATAAEKVRPDGVTAAAGTFESNVVRTVTSPRQSGDLYGVPRFLKDSDGRLLHGDSRNEYGLLALNNFLGVANLAYVVRANVNLDDNLANVRTLWDQKLQEASYVLEGLINNFLNVYNQSNNIPPGSPSFKVTVNRTELESLANQALDNVWKFSSFTTCENDFMDNHTAAPLNVYTNGYDAPVTGQYFGFKGEAATWEATGAGSVVSTEWTPVEAGDMLVGCADEFKYTLEFNARTSLGANDAARRATIVTALRQVIASNQDVRSETYEYNLIVCPGYFEVATDLIGLSTDVEEEAFVIADTPFDLDPDQVAVWAATSARARGSSVSYAYPHGMMTNAFTGEVVFAPSSAIILRTMAYSDKMSEVWFAAAGVRRGLVQNTSYVGYVTGVIGTATTVVEIALNRGQRDNLYKYFTNINPIVFFPDRGLIVWGQKTSAPAASAMDRINVVRLVMYVRRALRKGLQSFVFELNDKITRDNVNTFVSSMLADILARRGLYDFAVQCDTYNNTPDRIDRNELYVDVALKPVRVAEFIYAPVRVVNTGTEI